MVKRVKHCTRQQEVSNVYQQVFLPASKGLITSAPSSMIPDGAFQDVNNVRFDDGYIEKVKAFTEYKTIDNSPILAINLYRMNSNSLLNMIHTKTGLFNVMEGSDEFTNLLEDAEYEDNETYDISDTPYISSVVAFNKYFFCCPSSRIYCWRAGDPKAMALEGTYQPSKIWTANTQYEIGDIVRPTNDNYSGYIYKCVTAGTSGDTEVREEDGEQVSMWEKDMSTQIVDGTVHWVGCGSLEVEGSSASDVTAGCIEQYKDFLFIGNLKEDGEAYPTRLRWSQWQNPFLWHNNEDGSGMAGYVDVNDIDGKIVNMKRIGDILAIYKEGGIVAVTYSGGDTVFSKELITTRAGLVSPTAIVVLPHSHIFVSKDNIYQFDGNTVVPIGDPIRNYFLKHVKQKDKIIGFYNQYSKDVIFAFMETENATYNYSKALTYNTQLNTWSVRDINMSALGEYTEHSQLIIDEVHNPYDSEEMQETVIDGDEIDDFDSTIVAGDSDGKLYKFNGYADSRGDYDGYVITKTHHMDEPARIKRLMRIQFHVETQGDYDMYVQVRPSWQPETPQEEIDWESLPSYSLRFRNTDTEKQVTPPYVDLDLSARYFQIKFGTAHNNEYFKVLGYTLFYQLRSDA